MIKLLKNFFLFSSFILIYFLISNISNATSGCCSSHGGVCSNSCCDGTPLSSLCSNTIFSSHSTVNSIQTSETSSIAELKQPYLSEFAIRTTGFPLVKGVILNNEPYKTYYTKLPEVYFNLWLITHYTKLKINDEIISITDGKVDALSYNFDIKNLGEYKIRVISDKGIESAILARIIYNPGIEGVQDNIQSNIPLYRFWSAQNHGHFYTSSVAEKNQVIATYKPSEWQYEGVAYNVSDCSDSGSTPVYRFWSEQNKHHFYTNSVQEKDLVVKTYSQKEWKLEGQVFCAYSTLSTDMIPVYRFWSEQNHVHFYTASEQEKNDTVAKYTDKEWHLEGVAYFVKK